MRNLDYITIELNDRPATVKVTDYVTAKTKDLREFGYKTLTESEVMASVDKIRSGGEAVTVIDHFVKRDIILD